MQFNLDLNSKLNWFQMIVDNDYLLAFAVFFVVYVLTAMLNLPGTGALTLAAGISFGFLNGLILVSFAGSIGATLSMLMARTLLREWVHIRFSRFYNTINRGVQENGIGYLFVLRMIPVIPFFIVNPVFGLTKMRVWHFYLVSQIGMLPVNAISVNLGRTVGNLDSVSFSTVLTPQVIATFALLIVFPFIVKFAYQKYRNRKSAVSHTGG